MLMEEIKIVFVSFFENHFTCLLEKRCRCQLLCGRGVDPPPLTPL